MILATYQPYIKNENKSKSYLELEAYLGYEPIICFPANNAKEAILYSFLVDSNIPEKLIFFKTSKFVKLDIVQWTKKVAQDMRSSGVNVGHTAIEDCLTDKPDKYQEYVVQERIL